MIQYPLRVALMSVAMLCANLVPLSIYAKKSDTCEFKRDTCESLSFQGSFDIYDSGLGDPCEGVFEAGGQLVIQPYVVQPDGQEFALQTITVTSTGTYTTEEKTFESPQIGTWVFGYHGTAIDAPCIRVTPNPVIVKSSHYANSIKLFETEGFIAQGDAPQSAQEIVTFIYDLYIPPTKLDFVR
jgi:hypothetical protein